VANPDYNDICDNLLIPGWYRIISRAGVKMPTTCPFGGFRCGTTSPRHPYNDIIVLFPIRNTLEFTKEFCKYLNLNVAMFVGFCQKQSP
jgi:hypothetical protein